MTRRTNARIAGFTFLFYIAVGIAGLMLSGRALNGEGVAAKLAGLAHHATDLRVAVLLNLLACFSAIVLGVTLYALTREQDRDLALLGMACRVAEGVNGAVGIPQTLGLLWLATDTGAAALDTGAVHTLAAFLLQERAGISAIFFAVGSTLFSWLFLRGRMIPAPMAWLGVVASVLLVVLLPLQFAGFGGPGTWSSAVTWLQWMPMLVFELLLSTWLLVKGAAPPA